MKRLWNLLYFCFLWLGVSVKAQSSFYRRTYYNAPPTHYFSSHPGSSHEFLPISYSSDSHTEESKRKEFSKKYAKKIPYRHVASEEEDNSSERYSSSEYSNEAHHFNSKENDNSREYAIGTHIRVQHPITIPKKSTSSHYKYTTHIPNHFKNPNYADVNFSTESHDSKPPKYDTSSKKHINHHKYAQYFDADPFHVVSPPKTTLSAVSPTPSLGYNTFDAEQDEYDPHNGNTNRVKAQLRDRYKGVASQKQIEKYLEDQQKLLDEALKLQLLNNPKFQHLVKSKDVEPHYEESEFEELPIDPQPPPVYRQNYDENLTFKSGGRARRRPKGSDLKRSPKSSKPPTPIIGSSKRRFRPSLVINV